MTCEELVGLLVDLVEDDLDAETQAALHTHCHRCPDCDSFKNTYEVTRQLAEIAFGRALPDEARARIEGALRERLVREA
ncbi:MAG: hypothetical protein H6741_04155 [Alphaproteobacteria bacterium]|nr:hypothetical protein [Alphaproteobacteria bacterium]